jgi:protein subunit release factor B
MRNLILKIDIKTLRWDFFRGSGKGGQKRNKTENCSRCTHIESGAQGKSESGRSKEQNKKKSVDRMVENLVFIDWSQNFINNHVKEERILDISVEEDFILLFDLGKYEAPKRKKIKRKPVVKDRVKEDRRSSKKDLKDFN